MNLKTIVSYKNHFLLKWLLIRITSYMKMTLYINYNIKITTKRARIEMKNRNFYRWHSKWWFCSYSIGITVVFFLFFFCFLPLEWMREESGCGAERSIPKECRRPWVTEKERKGRESWRATEREREQLREGDGGKGRKICG